MSTRRRHRLVRLTVGWSLVVVVGLAAVGGLNEAHWFVLTLLGFLVAVHRTTALYVAPPWRRGLRVAVLAGVVVFALLVGVDVYATGTELLV